MGDSYACYRIGVDDATGEVVRTTVEHNEYAEPDWEDLAHAECVIGDNWETIWAFNMHLDLPNVPLEGKNVCSWAVERYEADPEGFSIDAFKTEQVL